MFPLFEQLYKATQDKENRDLAASQKKALLSSISNMNQNSDQEGMNLIFALISSYQFKHEHEKQSIIPYSGKVEENNDIQFDIENLPLQLRHIIYKFTTMHENRLKQDSENRT